MAIREHFLMDPQWRFSKGDFSAPRESNHWAMGRSFTWGPIDPAFDDSKWRLLDLPHDFAVEGSYDREVVVNGRTQTSASSLRVMHGFLRGGVGWYCKTCLEYFQRFSCYRTPNPESLRLYRV